MATPTARSRLQRDAPIMPWRPLYRAAEEGDVEEVRKLLAAGANLEVANDFGWMPLHIAAGNGHLEVVQALLDSGANKEAANKNGTTPLRVAVENGHLEVVQALLDNGASTTPLPEYLIAHTIHIAAHNGHPDVVQALLDRGANKEAANNNGWTPLYIAAQNGQLEVVRALLEHGANKEAANNNGWTPLYIAAQNGQLEVVRALLEHGANKDAANNNGWTPLYIAAQNGHLEVVRALLEHGANKDAANNNGRTSLSIAAENGHLEVVQALLDTGASIARMPSDLIGHTLVTAALNGHLEVVEVLLDLGANKEAASNRGWTPLHSAAANGHLEVVQALLDRGANKEAADNDGWTPLNSAAKKGHLEVVQALLDLGANKEAASNRGWTPLHAAASEGHLEVVQALLDRGANKEVANNRGCTPLIKAAQEGHLEVVQVLLDRGANKEAAIKNGWTPLRIAAEKDHVKVVIALLERGAEISDNDIERMLLPPQERFKTADKDGGTLLHIAARNGHADTVSLLLARGLDVDAVDSNDETSLHIAARNGHKDVVAILFPRVLRNFRNVSSWWTNLRGGLSSARGNFDPSINFVRGNSLLHLSAAVYDIDVMISSIQQGGDVDAENENGATALHVAVGVGPQVVKFLIDHGARWRLRDRKGRTPLQRLLRGDKSNPQYGRVLACLRDAERRVTLLHGGDGRARQEAWDDAGCVVRVRWFLVRSPGWGGSIGVVHSIIRVDVRDQNGSIDSYAMEKAATSRHRQDITNGIFVSRWNAVAQCDFVKEFEDIHLRRLRSGTLRMADLIRVAEDTGEYNLSRSNCHHAAMAIRNACVSEDQVKTVDQGPNAEYMAVLKVLGWSAKWLPASSESSGSVEVGSKHSLPSLIQSDFDLSEADRRLTTEEMRYASEAAFLS
eukprot:scaffold2353_cov178-Pinguiococcus_pyrenoidosus.AAC.1